MDWMPVGLDMDIDGDGDNEYSQYLQFLCGSARWFCRCYELLQYAAEIQIQDGYDHVRSTLKMWIKHEPSEEDISIFRKLIPGEIQVFKNNTNRRFIDKAHEFDRQVNPQFEEFPEVFNFERLPDYAITEFIAVKSRDLNNSAITNNQNQKVMNNGV